MRYFLFLEDEYSKKKELVGNKSSFLSFLIHSFDQKNITIPLGFSTTVFAFNDFIAQNKLKKNIDTLLQKITETPNQLKKELYAKQIGKLFESGKFTEDFFDELNYCYDYFLAKHPDTNAFAVRSSSTHEDLADASFAGQQETFLNIFTLKHISDAIKKVFASFYSVSVISYKTTKNIPLSAGAMCVCIQKMIRAKTSGIMFTADPQTGFKDVISISANYGLGESIVQGTINPDEYIVYKKNLSIIQKTFGNKTAKTEIKKTRSAGNSTKVTQLNKQEKNEFTLQDKQILKIAAIGIEIEKTCGEGLDIEWVEEAGTDNIFILQTRPITVCAQDESETTRYKVTISPEDVPLIAGKAIGTQSTIGRIRICTTTKEAASITKNEILVTRMTDPSWEPMMKKAAGIITDLGGRTCHAAIIARELGIPAIVGCTNASKKLKKDQLVTLCCSEGENGIVLEGEKPIFIEKKEKVFLRPSVKTKLMLNVGNPGASFALQKIPNEGIGLARMEFIIASIIKIHPKAAVEYKTLCQSVKTQIKKIIQGYTDPVFYFLEKLTHGISMIAASVFPKKVILRLSDFKTNEYRRLIGGTYFEEKEENPMLGFRGATRYLSPSFQECFALECLAIKKAREELGFKNIDIMVPFVRSVEEASEVIKLLEKHGLKRTPELRIIMMCEIPVNALMAEEFLEYFDGFSIGSNDMTQLTLGVDRDGNKNLHPLFDEKNKAVKTLLSLAIKACLKSGKYIGICGQAPSDHPEFALWLIKEGIETISLNPDSVEKLHHFLENNQINL